MGQQGKPIYLRKRFLLLVVVVILAVLIGFNFKAVKTSVRGTAEGLIHYAENADPLVAGLILGLVAVGDSSFLSIPEGNDFLVVYFSIIESPMMPYFVLVSAIGSVLGSLILFSMGRKGEGMFLTRRFSPERVERIRNWFRKYDIWAILIPCVIPPPMPFKLFVLTAGVLKFKYSRFIVATMIGRLVRYGIWGVLAVIFKDYIKYFMKHHLLELGVGMLVFLVLLGVGSYLFTLGRRRVTRLVEPTPIPPPTQEVPN